jgi:hypothetical protein
LHSLCTLYIYNGRSPAPGGTSSLEYLSLPRSRWKRRRKVMNTFTSADRLPCTACRSSR